MKQSDPNFLCADFLCRWTTNVFSNKKDEILSVHNFNVFSNKNDEILSIHNYKPHSMHLP